MRNNGLIKSLTLILGSALVTACGGGGGDSSSGSSGGNSTPPPPSTTLTLSSSASTLEVNEGETGTLTLSVNYTGSKTLSTSVSFGSGEFVDASVSDNTVTINASDVESIGVSDTMTVTVTDGTLSREVKVDIAVKNVSFWEEHAALKASVESLSDYAKNSTEALNMMIFMTDVDHRVGFISVDQFDAEMQTRLAAVQESQSKLSVYMDGFITRLSSSAVENAPQTESELTSLQGEVDNRVVEFVSDMTTVLDTVISMDGSILPEITLSELSETPSGHSLFLNNPYLGDDDESGWVISGMFDFILPIIESNVCYAI